MTEPNPRRDDVLRAVADELYLAKFKMDTERWERRLARRRKYALWALLPYTACGLLCGCAVARVLDTGDGLTAAMLIVGYIGFLALQWVTPELLRRREATDE
jgi:hypothetical protein